MVQLNAPPLTSAEVARDILSDDPPPTEATQATAGAELKARRRDSRSARLTSSGMRQVGANGLTRIVFSREFSKAPHVEGTVVESADFGPPVFVVRQYLKNTGTAAAPVYAERKIDGSDDAPIVGCDFYGYRINPRTPTVPQLTVLTLLNFVFGTVNGLFNTITTALSNQPTTAPLAQGTAFTYFALAQSE